MSDEYASGSSTTGTAADSEVEADDATAADREGNSPETDGGQQAYTVRLELVDEPGELLRALAPISEHGGNLLSIHHERGNITPRGHIPVEVDLECVPARFDDVVDGLREAGINVIQAGPERYGEELTVVLVGHLVETDLSDSLSRIEGEAHAGVLDLSLNAPDGTDAISSARLRLAVDTGRRETVLDALRSLADEKGLSLIEPLSGGEI
ncbi:amino acid-binding protein [Natronosalvus halobius]|uniref:amino acid-binding protein n=1 Tax=Natronosalvus halobius TaxID=2953746 RepID=UPI0020A12BA5|nr:amino acid-binding protein [Natronosalvus halobius]USZ72008.1 amino acid-binding protein [Natronosalvus halobius]